MRGTLSTDTPTETSDVNRIWSSVIDAATMRLYAAYERPRYVGPNPAVVAIDLYNLAYAGGDYELEAISGRHPSSCGKYAWEALKPTQSFLDTCRGLRVPVLFTTGRPTAKRATLRQSGFGNSADDYEIFDGIYREGEPIIVKERASAFYGTALADSLTQGGIDTLIILGESTSGCVRASVVEGYSNGFHVVVVPECCFDRSPVSHKVALFDMHHKYADVMPADEVARRLGDLCRAS